MLKYLTKISMDIFPSVLATIIGAYIVNHYINARPAPDTPAAAVAPAHTKKDGKPGDVANLPAPGIKAKGISEKSVTDKPAAEKAAADKPVEKAGDQPAETKPSESKAADVAPPETAAASRGRQPTPKSVAKANPAPVVAAPAAAPAVEANAAAAAPANQDANDLARAAIERLRKSPEAKSVEKAPEAASQDTAHAPETPRVVTTAPQAVRPLPPPITVSTPPTETYTSSPANPPYTASVGNEDANRLTPPADIPVPVLAPPLDLRADATGSMPAPKPKTNVADEMLSGMKSMFHSVLPKNITPN
ncbi:hypothetical protein C2U70_02430 [Bradyrhizobium guangdongense]|uniref:hypothetical protein n=1 Tax=Bradyrhizobium guangdongense TaxID=1325090 RepID=UPI00112BB9F2|nr:hypothetical protein [Bradyrhizobium guangdongense]TPQ41734.1 hypothetical protein C2U70_02430 [Bradyrhizobium guangdongense]